MPSVRTGDFDCWYEVDDFTDPWTESEPILIQHGFGRNGRYWYSWVPDLARHHRVIRRDMRGHGGSTDTGPDYEWTFEGLVQDVVHFLDALDLERVHFVGESVGGPTGIGLGAWHPERLLSLTLVSGVLRLGEEVQRIFRGRYPDWPTALRELGPGGWVTQTPPRDPNDPLEAAEREWNRREWDRTNGYVLEGLARLTPKLEVEPLLPQVKVPTLIMAPADSPLTPLRDQVTMREKIPDARMEVFDGYGHNFYPHVPTRCTASLLHFFSSLRSRSGSPANVGIQGRRTRKENEETPVETHRPR